MLAEKPRSRALRILREAVTTSFVAGHPIPPERDLADLCQVSRTTVRLALDQLTDEGLLRPIVGRSRMVTPPHVRSTSANGSVYLIASLADTHTSRCSGWPGHIQLGAMESLRQRGRSVLIPGSGKVDAETILMVQRDRPAGVLLAESMYYTISSADLQVATDIFAGAGVPTVVFGESPETCDRVCSDHEAGCHALTRWLLERGRSRQLCLWSGSSTTPWQVRRRAGHERALREAGQTAIPVEWVRWTGAEESFEDMVLKIAGHLVPYLMAAQPIDAILALIDAHVPAICAALKRCGREPGRDVLVVGYDAVWDECIERLHCPIPPAATVDKRNLEIGRAMVTLLEERVARRLPDGPQTRMIEPRVVVI